jgi:hypothetical protein
MQCQQCGCTDNHACPDGCFWVFRSPPMCSRCVFDAIAAAAVGFDEETRFAIGERLVDLADRIHPENQARQAALEASEDELPPGFDPLAYPTDQGLWLPGDA